jgi:hypothetical protein
MMKARVELEKIDWDRKTDEGRYKGKLPKHLVVVFSVSEDDTIDQIIDQSIDVASDDFGFLINSAKARSIKIT